MPELPEVETVRRGLSPAMQGEVIERVTLNRKDLRFPFPEKFAERLEGARVLDVGRRAKFLVLTLDTDETLLMHLGMSGRFLLDGEGFEGFTHDNSVKPDHNHVVIRMKNDVNITYNDPRRFGFMELYPTDELEDTVRFIHLGPEPNGNAFSGAYLAQTLTGKKTPIKSALLDQSIVAGLGNIYVCEALFRSGISPRRLASSIKGARAERLAGHVRDVINEAIEAGGSSISDFAKTDGSLGYFQHNFAVYGREGKACNSCGEPIRRIVQSGRSSFYCGKCQR